MVVYADILMLVNFIVDYFLILISAKFLNKKPRLWRLVLSAIIGAVFSLYIFLPQSNFFFQCAVQILMSMVLCVAAFGFENIKTFLRDTVVLFCVNFAYSGAMIAVWLIFKPQSMIINNSVIYFNISPWFLILFSVIGYFFVALARQLLKRNFMPNTYCTATLFCANKSINLQGIADTGNSIVDVFGISQIFIVEEDTVNILLGTNKDDYTRVRKVPCSTITGEKLLNGYRIDSAQITYGKNKYNFKNPIIAVSPTPLAECKIIINPQALN